jgi:GWxTD domain-containing protein
VATGHRAVRRLAAALPLLSWLALACQSGGRVSPAGGLAEGPTRWLMLPEELRQVQRLRTPREAVEFLDDFWRRRDPDPEKPGNEVARAFYERVEAADRLYGEGATRGCLTDRGRALILLGPPPVLRYTQKRVPDWDPGRPGARAAIQSHNVTEETWAYSLADLPPALAALLAEERSETEQQVELVFLIDPLHTKLLEGERYLDLAVRAGVGQHGHTDEHGPTTDFHGRKSSPQRVLR